MVRPLAMWSILLLAWLGCNRPLPAQPPPDEDSIPRPDMTPNEELDRHVHQLYSEHGEDRRAAMRWFCDHADISRQRLRSFLQPLEEEWPASAAIEALECIGHPDDVPLLEEVLTGGRLAFEAARALSRNPSPAALQALARASASADVEVARSAILGLGWRKDESARALLEERLGHADARVRWSAVLAIEEMGDGPSAPALRAALAKETDKDVKERIRKLLR
jgi:HEAT repeat protein